MSCFSSSPVWGGSYRENRKEMVIVDVEVSDEELEGDYGEVSGLCLTCSQCGH